MNQPSGFFRDLVPPVDELKKVGPIFDRPTYLTSGKRSAEHLIKYAGLKPEHSVLDIGCGFGRVAIHLLRILAPNSTYVGIDVVKEEIDWCQRNISPRNDHFLFVHLDAKNGMYNPNGTLSADSVQLPVPAGLQFELVYLFSVFTHMLPQQVANYLHEIFRRLKPGGTLFATFFLINDESKRLMDAGEGQFRFVRQRGGYYVSDTRIHEAAVAYDEADVWQMMEQAGFVRDNLIPGSWPGSRTADHGQDFVVCAKPK